MAVQAERGLTVRADRTISDPTEERRLLRQLILKNASEEQTNLVIGICDRYGFDPMLKHVVIVSNNLYVTRDGLLHLAHQSGQFDGIEVDMQVLPSGEWVATCTVYRKDMSRPIRYSAFESEHKPTNTANSAWDKYPRAMLQKCAEVMALRRAFDVSVGAAEEIGYDGITPQTSAGRVTVIEAAPTRQAEPALIEATVVPTPTILSAREFAQFLHDISQQAHDGIASSDILKLLNTYNNHLSADQHQLAGNLWKRIIAARKAGEAWPAPAALVEVVEAVEELATAAALAASDDPFGDGAPASIYG